MAAKAKWDSIPTATDRGLLYGYGPRLYVATRYSSYGIAEVYSSGGDNYFTTSQRWSHRRSQKRRSTLDEHGYDNLS
jgi:hypothetical protein